MLQRDWLERKGQAMKLRCSGAAGSQIRLKLEGHGIIDPKQGLTCP